MSNKYSTGRYIIDVYDKYGTKQNTELADSLFKARTVGETLIKEPPYASFTVMRVVLNSLDGFNPWTGSDA